MTAVLAALLSAGIRFGAPFSDGVVLQRDRPVPVWGEAAPGQPVKVSFGGQTCETRADPQGRWRVDLAPMPASAEPRELLANVVPVRDVLVGEVWLCSGQSNMELPLCGAAARYRDRQGALVAQMTRKPLVRFANVSSYRGAADELQMPNREFRWQKAVPENLLQNGAFSAVGIYFALEIHAALGVPVGVVGAYVGGTRIEPWIPKEGFASVHGLEAERDYRPLFGDAFSAERMGELLPHYSDHHRLERQQPSVLWNSHLAALAPYAMRGVVWYQGCSNSLDFDRYTSMMHALWNGWSRRFENPKLPFYFVQIAPFGWAQTLPQIQAAQARFAAEQPCAAMAIVNDLGNEFNEIHPNEKELVAKRLAVHALKRDYGFRWVQDESPSVQSWRIEGDRFVLTFGNARSLHYYNRDPAEPCMGFEIAGEDGVWRPARIADECLDRSSVSRVGGIVSTTVSLSAQGVKAPKRIRYLYAKPWRGALYNEVDLPLGSFEAGEWADMLVQVKSTFDGTPQPCYFWAPKSAGTNAVPLIVGLHTWSHGYMSTSHYGTVLSYAQKHGWAMVGPNFRGPNKTPPACGGDPAVQDIVDAVNHAKSHVKIDPARVYIAGGSGGGHMTLLMLGRHPEIFAAGAAFCPITDLARWHADSLLDHPGRGKVYAQMLEAACGGTPAEKPEEYARRSPLTWLDRARKAGVGVYIVTGIHDGWKGSVPVGHSFRAFNALANPGDRVSEADIAAIEETQQVPAALAYDGPADPFYPERMRIHFRRTSANVRFTLMEGGHGGNYGAGLDFLSRQAKGRPADFSLPSAGNGREEALGK